jgi:L-cysteate sulfo-lyase
MTGRPTPRPAAAGGPAATSGPAPAGGPATRPWDGLPRLRFAPLPTPLDLLPRFGAVIGAEVWAKRDDVGSITLAGNKARKLEFLIADALASGCDSIVAVGAIQSNFARAAAAAAASAGLRAILVLRPTPAGVTNGNALLDRAVGADVRVTPPDGPSYRRMIEDTMAGLRAAGGNPCLLPVGGSTPLGDIGYAAAWDELLAQLDAAGTAPSRLLVAVGSGGTQAGLEVGRAITGRGPRITGVAVLRIEPDVPALVARLASDTAVRIGIDARWTPADVDVDLDFMGEAYGVPTEGTNEAIDLLARTEGILADPVYSGKALAGLVAYARAGRLDGPVVFWHTGGAQVLFSEAFAADK